MTNKKFKLAAMSLALTACVAASPLAANAESAGTEATSSAPAAETSADETKQESTDESKQESTNESKQESTDESKQESTDESKQESTDETKQESTDESKQESTDETKQESTDETEQESTDETKQESTDESKQESTDETKQESTDETKQESTDETKQESTDESKQESTDESKQESTDESKQESTDESKQDSADETKQESTDESKQESTDESKQEAADKNEQNPADETKPEVAVENKALAAAPVAKAPVLMTAALAKAPAAPTAPAEENTAAEDVATLNGKGYKSFDEAVSKANDGDTIEVIKDATSTGIDLRNKKLTIKGKTVTTTTDSGTEEKTTVKPKLKFVAKEGKSQIAGITLWGSDLTFQNMDVDMTGASSTTYNKWNAVCMSDNAALTLNNTDLSMDGKDLDASAQGIYMAGRGRNELNVDDHSTLTINNYYNAIAWDGVADNNKGSTYFINITDGSTFTADGNDAGIIGRESLDVLVDNSTLTVTNCTGRSGFNGADVKIVNGSTANISGNHEGYGIHANDLLVENSTLTANNNGYGGIRITGKGEFTNSTVTVTGTEEKGNASVEIACGIANETRTGPLNGSLSVRNSTLNISDNKATGIACRTSKNGQFHSSLTIDDASRVTIQNNNATPKNDFNANGDIGGGLRIEAGSTAVLGRSTVINNNTAKSGGGVYTKGGKVTINNSTITENKATGNGGGICAEDNSTVTVVGGEISSNTSTGVEQTASGGGGLYTNNSTVTLDKVTITDNKAITDPRNDGGGVLAVGSNLTITGSTITENTAPDCGGGLFLSHTNANITGSTIEGNQATYGAGVYLNDSPDVAEADCTGSHTHNIIGTKINHNTASSIGGGMYVGTKSNVTLTGSTLDGNATTDKTGGQGGAIVAYGAGDITLDSTTITNNDAAVGGGLFSLGVAVSDTHITLRNNTKFTGNTAASGAGIYLMRSSGNNILLELSDSAIDNNIASDWGGGIFAYNGAEVKANNTSISNNKGGNAGGLLVWNNSSAELSNGSKVSGNTATNGNGGGVYAINGTVTATDCDISDNDAGQYNGGGICAQNSTLTLEKNTLNRNKSKSGGAIWMNASDAALTGNTITHNTATGNGGGIYGEQRATIDLRTGALYNNHAGTAGDDIYLNNTTLILRPVGDDWILDDCGHPIDGWYLDGKDARWDADSQKKFVTNLDALLEGTDYEIEKGEDGCYIITIGSNALALKAAHDAPPTPEPDPDGPDTPNPNPNPKPEPKPGPDTPVTPEDPQLPPVQDARADTPDSPVLPANPTNPAVQDAHALPQTGTSLFAALAMALSGFALTIAGAWASLLGKNSRH